MEKLLNTTAKAPVRVARALLWIMTCAIPVFIAACYGPPSMAASGSTRLRRVIGRAVSAMSGAGVEGIRVRCVNSEGEGAPGEIDTTYTMTGDGAFEVWHGEYSPCRYLVFEDVDGGDNGGLFAKKRVEYDPIQGETVVELESAE